jgi:quercetin dioxygenase-like cupin family protein
MKKISIIIVCLAFAGIINAANSKISEKASSLRLLQDSIIRKRIFMAEFPVRSVSSVDVREITFKPKQKTGKHLHPIPVMGYIVSGTVVFEAKGQSLRTLHAGDAFYEPANTVILHFDNPSDTEPLKFVAYYLLNGETEFIRMLPDKPVN